jgi:hypothetical protein
MRAKSLTPKTFPRNNCQCELTRTKVAHTTCNFQPTTESVEGCAEYLVSGFSFREFPLRK